MAVDIVMPQMGESIFEGTITKWLKKPGDKVERDEPLFEISTDKVDAEIPSPSAGVLKEIKVGEGQTVPIQTVVGVIDAAGSAAAPARAPAKTEAPAPFAPAPVKAATPAAPPAAAPNVAPAPVAAAPRAAMPAAAPPAAQDGGRIHSSPLVRRMASEHGIDLSSVTGTGAGGRISKQDIEAVIAAGGAPAAVPPASGVSAAPSRPAPPPAAAPAPPGVPGAQAHVALETAVPREKIYFGHYEVQPMSPMRQRIAEHMVASKRVSAHVYSVDEIDMTKVAALRAKSKDEFEKRYETKLTFMPFFVKAAVAGLRAYPTLNASLDGTNVILHKEINVGIAVALDWGLLVPVVKNAVEENEARRSAGEHLLHHQPGRLWRPVRATGDQPAQRGHPWSRSHREAPRGHQRLDRHPLDVLRDTELRPSRGGRSDCSPVPPQGQRDFGKLERARSIGFHPFLVPGR